jgi:predicted permease
MTRRPPALASWLVSRITPPEDRDPLLGDLEEEYRRLLARDGPATARRFYWGEALRALGPGLRRRLRVQFDGDAVPHGPISDRGGSMLGAFRLDLRVAARTLLRHPRLSAAVGLTIAVGIAANTAVFALVDAVVLRPFPFPEPERLVTVGTVIPKLRQELSFWENLSAAEYLDIARECKTLERVVAWDMGNRQVAHTGAPENLFSAFFWGDAFPTLGMAPVLGRGFTAEETRRGDKVAIVSHRYWATRLRGDPGAVSGRILVNGEPYTLVGVMPEKALVYATDLWLPMPVRPEVFPRPRRQFQVLARLAPGRTLDDANAELGLLAARLAVAHGAEVPEYDGIRFVAYTWNDANVRTLKVAALLVTGAAGFVLLLACANVASLLLARAAARGREMAVRCALGAGRAALARQLLSECLLLSLGGGLVGTMLAALAVRSLGAALASLLLPVALPVELVLSGRALGYALVASVGAGLAFGLAPALAAMRRDPGLTLHAEPGTAAGAPSRLRAERLLVAVEVASAAVLLVGSGLLLRSLDRLGRVDPGLAASELVGFRVTLPPERYDTAGIQRFFRELEGQAGTVPGALCATVADQYPPIAFSRTRFRVTGAEPRDDDALPSALLTAVSASYLRTTGVGLRAGRFLGEDDGPGRPLVAVVNETAARRYFGGAADAPGRTFEIGSGDGARRIEVVGVVSDARNRGLDRPADPELFYHLYQDPRPANQYIVLVRSGIDPLSLVPALRARVAALDSQQPIYAVQTVRQALESPGLPRRVASSLLLVLTAVALVLAGTGIFAVVSHVAASRTREIGVRMAVGATARQVRGLVVRQALVPAALGGGVGILGAVGLASALGGLIFDVRPFDPLTLLATAALLVGLAALASDGPARRAARIDPVAALRVE